jgi:hypothetical protein
MADAAADPHIAPARTQTTSQTPHLEESQKADRKAVNNATHTRPAQRPEEARPAGLEPATCGLEVRCSIL